MVRSLKSKLEQSICTHDPASVVTLIQVNNKLLGEECKSNKTPGCDTGQQTTAKEWFHAHFQGYATPPSQNVAGKQGSVPQNQITVYEKSLLICI